jgi:hypothetical protein
MPPQTIALAECRTDHSIETLPLFSPAECQVVRSTVIKLRASWFQRTPLLPFYTLGAASYLDAQENEAKYIERACLYNPVLQEHFGWLYERLADSLARRLGAPATYGPNVALPGFHVFLAHPAYMKVPSSIHVDSQYQNLNWSWAHKVSQPISFTVAISLPNEGSGINFWRLSGADLAGLPQEEVNRMLREKRTFFPYAIGCLHLHFGHLIHQVATPKQLLKGDERITLQGHGLLCDGTWQLYW